MGGSVDVEDLAADVVSLVAAHCRLLAEKTSNRVAEAASDRVVRLIQEYVFELVEERLQNDEFARAALARLCDGPDDPRRLRTLEATMSEVVDGDRDFAEELDDMVTRARRAGFEPTAIHANVTVGSMRRSQVSLGPMTITNSRQLRVSLGVAGISILVGLVIFLVARQPDNQAALIDTGPEQGTRGSRMEPDAGTASASSLAPEDAGSVGPEVTVAAFFEAIYEQDCTTLIYSVTEAALPEDSPTREEAIASCRATMGPYGEGYFPVGPTLDDAALVSAEVVDRRDQQAVVNVRYRGSYSTSTEDIEIVTVEENGQWLIATEGLVVIQTDNLG